MTQSGRLSKARFRRSPKRVALLAVADSPQWVDSADAVAVRAAAAMEIVAIVAVAKADVAASAAIQAPNGKSCKKRSIPKLRQTRSKPNSRKCAKPAKRTKRSSKP